MFGIYLFFWVNYSHIKKVKKKKKFTSMRSVSAIAGKKQKEKLINEVKY